MNFLRRLFGKKRVDDYEPVINPNRDENLFAKTTEGYIIAQDVSCQYEYVSNAPCSHCGATKLSVAAQLNRASQGLNELVCKCGRCGKMSGIIFDVSNTVYQTWLAKHLGKLYVSSYDGKPRKPTR